MTKRLLHLLKLGFKRRGWIMSTLWVLWLLIFLLLVRLAWVPFVLAFWILSTSLDGRIQEIQDEMQDE